MTVRNILIFTSAVFLFAACSGENEDRYQFEGESVLDTETGDEYILENPDTMTVVHIDGTSEPITVSSTPFAESEELNQMMEKYRANMEKRKEELLAKEKARIKNEREERYADFSDEELEEEFRKLHENDAPFEQQMDIVAELVNREVILEIDAAELLEIDPKDVDMDVEWESTSTSDQAGQ
ncbi:hypothetical protein SAMN04488057_11159 [Cyclobacterium lianum]|uniref:Uncharacterized protein n=1 Tax=Cyclobacterium lianum TaxID=388280 RepID=A0A1M7PWJ7_9BACT|nr:hypothetical protein [Cyclobacterium lianum]SHN21895.1 hypothetical protein SAMN04488057_11159 [Cyclobacterium lianum]